MPDAKDSHWKAQLEGKLMESVRAAAKSASPKVVGAELDLQNKSIHVPTSDVLKAVERTAIRVAVLTAVRAVFPNARPMIVDARRPHPHRYTLHLPDPSPVLKPFRVDHAVTEVDVDLAALMSLRATYDLLRMHAGFADYVATFALGGVPAANYVTDAAFGEGRAPGNDAALTRLAELREKYHVFPGLNWDSPGVDAVTRLVCDWLDGLPPGASVLFFDTGTMGNGVRQIFNLVMAYVGSRHRVPLQKVYVLGVVDGHSAAQRTEREKVSSGAGQEVPIQIDYARVPKLVTEDCEELIGYESIRSLGLLQPVSANVMMKVLDEFGKPFSFVGGARTAAATLESLLRGGLPQVSGLQVGGAMIHESAIVSTVLATAFEREVTELRNAAELGLVEEPAYRATLEALTETYRRQIENYPKTAIKGGKKTKKKATKKRRAGRKGDDGRPR